MKRPEGPGKDFDDMWNESRRRGHEKASRGEGAYSTDKYLERVNAQPRPAHHAKPNSDSCVVPLALLGGLAWAIAEAAGRILS